MLKAVKKLQGKRPPRVTLLHGPEPFFRFQILKRVRKHYKTRGYAIEVLDAAKLKEKGIVNALDTTGLFGADKLVIITNAEKLKGKVPTLTQYLKDPSDTVLAIFDYATSPKSKSMSPLGKALQKEAYVFESKILNGNRKEHVKWLVKEAGAAGKTLPAGFANAIYVNTGESLFALRTALQKVVLHSDSVIIRKEDVQAVIRKTSTNQIYELTEAFGRRDLSKSLQLIDAFYRQNDEPSVWIAKALSNAVERQLKSKSLLEYGLDPKDVAKILRVNPWRFTEHIQPQLKKFTILELLEIYESLCQVDILIKSSNLTRRAILESFLIKSLSRRTNG